VTARVEHIAGETYHGRKGAVRNAFRYGIDYVLLDAEAEVETPALFARNRTGVISLQDRDHGGAPGQGRGAVWVREVLAAHGVEGVRRIELLAQPRALGYVFNPVSFWLCRDGEGALATVIAEVTNTYGDRHCYLCRNDDGRSIAATDHIAATKIFHVSPFQPVEGRYDFTFDIRPDRIDIRIDYTAGNGGLVATLSGERQPLTNAGILRALVTRPLGARRVLALIHWQALKLWWKGAQFRARPLPPAKDVSGG
jgi:uncharacterized protein